MTRNFLLLVVFLSITLIFAATPTTEELWEQWKNTYGKNYDNTEEEYRFLIFKQNLERIKLYQRMDSGAQYGTTQFADLTRQEFRSQFLGFNLTLRNTNIQLNEEPNYYKPTIKDIPDTYDWRDHGAVTPVKNQKQCGSCWAFSAIQNIEGQQAIKHGELLVLSEQELVDCDDIDHGCGGGLMDKAFEWLEENGGVALEQDYPYTGGMNKCQFSKQEAKVKLTGYKNISDDETEIAQSLVELGPLSIAVVADPWQFYIGGIANPWLCGGQLDHGVLLVGYGTGRRLFRETDYWIIKNSWGPHWGEKGYIRLARGKGACGLGRFVITSQIE